MEARIKKLKCYQQYYQQNWLMFQSFDFQFNYLANKYLDIKFQAQSMQNQHLDLIKVVAVKR